MPRSDTPTTSSGTRVTSSESTDRPRSHRRRWALVALAAVVVSAAGIVAAVNVSGSPASTGLPKLTDTVFTVDGVAVPYRELRIFIQDDRSNVFGQYGGAAADDAQGFWSTPISGVTPSQRLMRQATEDAVKTSVQFHLAEKYGLIGSANYGSLVVSFEAENRQRREALATGKPVYGPQQFTEDGYLAYVTGNLAAELQQKLVDKGVLAATEASLRRYFAAHRAEFSGGSGIGPTTETYSSLKKQVRTRYLDSVYLQLVDDRAAAASVVPTKRYAAVETSGCFATGNC